jgi:hypothetical protein
MSQVFARTAGGLREKWRFHTLPTVWVEGTSDVTFYEPLSREPAFRIEPYFGCENARSLIDGILEDDNPYVVILDGDYSILTPKRTKHRRVIHLKRHSIENYLWEPRVINGACLRHAAIADDIDCAIAVLSAAAIQLETDFLDLVVLDVACRGLNPAPKVLPDRIDMVLRAKTGVAVDPKKLQPFRDGATRVVNRRDLARARKHVKEFLHARPFVHLLNGHLIWGAIRLSFTGITRGLGVSGAVTDNLLMQLLADRVWRILPSSDHKAVRNAIRKAINEVAGRFGALTKPSEKGASMTRVRRA